MNPGGYGGGGGYGPPGGGGGGWGEPPGGAPPGGGGGWGQPPGGAPPGGGGWGQPPGGAPPGGGGGWGPPPGGAPPGGGGGGGGWGGGPPGGFAPTPQGMPPGYQPPTGASPMGGGVPWEGEGGVFGRWWDTVKAVNGNDSRSFFAAAAQNESGSAITFSMMSGAIAGVVLVIFAGVWVAVFGAAMLSLATAGGGRGSPGVGMAAGAIGVGVAVFYAVAIAVFVTIAAAIAPFVMGGVHHVVLLMLGGIGQGKTYMHTVRVVAYADGAARAWNLVPMFGGLLYAIFNLKNLVQGYDETHKCGAGKAVIAIFSPLICCCFCYLMIFVVGIGTNLLGAASGHR